MNVTHVINHLDIGGAEKLLAQTLMESHEFHRDVHQQVIVLSHLGYWGEALSKQGIQVQALNLSNRDLISATWQVRRALRRYQSDIVHAHLFPASYIIPIAVSGLKTIPVYTEHSTWNKRREIRWLRPLEARLFRRFERIYAISDEAKSALIKHIPDLAAKTIVHANGIQLPVVSKQNFELSKPLKLLFVGRLVPDKGLDLLLESMRILINNSVHCELTVVGTGKRQSQYEQFARQHRLPVFFSGFSPNVYDAMLTHDVLIVPSRREGFGLVAVEGMAAGIPLIASSAGNLRSLLEGKQVGLMFSQEKPESLADAIRLIITNPDLRTSMANNAKLYAQTFSIKESTRKLLTSYSSLLA